MPKYYFSNGTGLTNLSYIGTDDEESDCPKLFRQVNRLETPYRYDPDPNNIMGDWYRYLVNELYGMPKKEETMKTVPTYAVKKIIYNPPATIVFWEDGSKTVVKCSKDDEYSPYYGFLAALAKKVYGNPSRVRKIVDKWAPKEEEPLNDIAKAFKAAMESVQSLAEHFDKATDDKE